MIRIFFTTKKLQSRISIGDDCLYIPMFFVKGDHRNSKAAERKGSRSRTASWAAWGWRLGVAIAPNRRRGARGIVEEFAKIWLNFITRGFRFRSIWYLFRVDLERHSMGYMSCQFTIVLVGCSCAIWESSGCSIPRCSRIGINFCIKILLRPSNTDLQKFKKMI